MIRAGTENSPVNVQGTTRTGVLARGSNRDSYSWVDINLDGLNATRLTGYVGRTGADVYAPNTSLRRITIYGDGNVLRYFYIDGYTQVAPFEVDISGVSTLRLHFQAIGPANEGGVSLTMFDLEVGWGD